MSRRCRRGCCCHRHGRTGAWLFLLVLFYMAAGSWAWLVLPVLALMLLAAWGASLRDRPE